jgi:predicted dehydrogenase
VTPVTQDSSLARSGRPLRFGLAGTGHWARIAHAPALGSTAGIEFAAVWGRNHESAGALAARYGATAHRDFDAFLADVDGVAFSIPPDVQSILAQRAATAGKHLLLEKPISTQLDTADELADAARDARVASVVFFIARFQPSIRAWLASNPPGNWNGGSAVWFGSALTESSPFNTPWRHDKGALWDLGPHAVSLLWAGLGPVVGVTADAGRGDLSHLILHHDGGATSTVTVTLSAPAAADDFELYLWGESGRTDMPALTHEPVAALRIALTELADSARSGHPAHPCDVHFGREVTRVLARAQDQIDARRARAGATSPSDDL